MPVLYIRGFIGLFLFLLGIVLWIFEATKVVAPFAVGFGAGMMSNGFQ